MFDETWQLFAMTAVAFEVESFFIPELSGRLSDVGDTLMYVSGAISGNLGGPRVGNNVKLNQLLSQL